MAISEFERRIQEAEAQEFSGWDFSWLRGRWDEHDPTWDYKQLVEERLTGISALLDMGTGGGEFLASLHALPEYSCATEGYALNIPIAQARLAPLGVKVFPFSDDRELPFADQSFDLIINRHESYDVSEVFRILKPGGIFLTQQVGARGCMQLNEFLGAPVEEDAVNWRIAQELEPLVAAGFRILNWDEQSLESIFYDIGAVVYYLKVIAWQIEDFSVEAYKPALLRLHDYILQNGWFKARAHRFLIEAKKQ
jgi:SAM-dependent methyltransferase